jgi:hypothetical protein
VIAFAPSPLEMVLDRLREGGYGPVGCGDQWTARCPAHEDRNPSLSIGVGEEGRALLNCHRGCGYEAICAALGVPPGDLFVRSVMPRKPMPPKPMPLPSKREPKPKRLHATHEAAFAATGRAKQWGAPTVTWQYVTGVADPWIAVARYDTAEGKQFTQATLVEGSGWFVGLERGQPRPLYNLSVIIDSDEVWIVEGEKCADLLCGLGLCGTTALGGAKATNKANLRPLSGRERVVLIPDQNAAGEEYVRDLAEMLHALPEPPKEIKIVRLPDIGPGEDVEQFIQLHGPSEARLELLRLADEAGVEKPPVAPADPSDGATEYVPEEAVVAKPLSMGELLASYTGLRKSVIRGLLRQGETMNIIAASKARKSWLVVDLALAVATGRDWLGIFGTDSGQVLILDNELHPETTAYRLREIAKARNIPTDTVADRVFVDNLRGRLLDVAKLAPYFESLEPGRYKLIVLDALYRFLPPGTDENDNGMMAEVYDLLDAYAARLGCCFVLIHHASKGNQSDKSVTDVGAGAGAQSRATDTHLVLRPHEEDDVVVMEGAARSWPPIDPMCLRWSFPVWAPDDTLDPASLQRRAPRQQKEPKPKKAKPAPWSVDQFVEAFFSAEPTKLAALRQAATEGRGIPHRQFTGLLSLAEQQGKVERVTLPGRGAPAGFVVATGEGQS